MKIKVCGMRDGANIAEVTALGVDFIGMIFWDGSPRNVTMIPTRAGIIPDRANEQCIMNNEQFKRVGVFVDEMPQNIITRVVNFHLDIVQLHGHESPTVIRNLRATLDPDIRPCVQFWKAISIATAEDLNACRQYEDCVDAFVFDTRVSQGGEAMPGGSGQQYDWHLLDAYHGPVPFLLSGGIGSDDAERVKAFHHPMCMGIDLNSRFETAPAIKDVTMLRHFLEELQHIS